MTEQEILRVLADYRAKSMQEIRAAIQQHRKTQQEILATLQQRREKILAELARYR